jgi:hypothetical protein
MDSVNLKLLENEVKKTKNDQFMTISFRKKGAEKVVTPIKV